MQISAFLGGNYASLGGNYASLTKDGYNCPKHACVSILQILKACWHESGNIRTRKNTSFVKLNVLPLYQKKKTGFSNFSQKSESSTNPEVLDL